MDITTFKSLLTTMNEVGIVRCVFEPTDDGGTMARGSNKEKSVVIYHKFDESLVDLPVGIQSVAGFLSRMELFDEEKSKIELEDNGEIIISATIKQGRKKASFRFADPHSKTAMPVPSKVPGVFEMTNCIELDEQYAKYLSSAFTAMGFTGDKAKRTISFRSSDEGAKLRVTDGEHDSFVDTIESEVDIDGEVTWDVVSFDRLMKASQNNRPDKKAVFSVNEQHVGVFDLSGVYALAVPVH